MVNLSYHLSDKITTSLKEIEALRTKILLTPLLPKIEQKIRWESNINKTYWGLTLADNKLSKTQIVKLLSSPLPKKMSGEEKEVINYINTLNYIRNEWTGSKNLLNPKKILDIYDLLCKSVFGSTASYFKSKEIEVNKILEFIESGKDHPVIQSGLIQIEIIKLSPFENATGRVARILSHLILSKYGYDLNGFLVLEDYYRDDLVSLKEATNSIERYKNATKWLEYFTQGVKLGMEKVLKNHELTGSEPVRQLGWKLTDRQNKIMGTLENPNQKITNKDVQKIFKVSQITASRDLSKMANLGILLPHGKGRSTFYTKV